MSGNGWFGILGTVVTLAVTKLTTSHIIPFLQVGRRQKYAQHISIIADELTDELMERYPDNEWLQHVDAAVNKLITICNINNASVASRAMKAAVNRKTRKE